MTVIVAAQTKADGVVVACDAQTTWGWQKLEANREKIWTTKQLVVGSAGSVRPAQIIQHHTDWPVFHADEDTHLEAFTIKRLLPAIRKALRDNGALKKEAEVESAEATLLLAWGDYLTVIAGDGAVVTPRPGRAAIGSGAQEALGYLGEDGPWTKTQVIEAARRATLTAVGCDGPIHYATTRSLAVEVA